MDRRTLHCLIFFIQLGTLFFYSGSSVTNIEANRPQQIKKLLSSIFTRKKDITTPMTTIPTINPTIPITTTSPVINPTMSNPDSTAQPAATASPSPVVVVSSSRSWCVASQSASQTALQVALDYACSYGGADCAAIQLGGGCYTPNTLRDHASFAFNSYYQKNPIPTSCNFGGTAVTISTDPSYGTCQYPSTSTSSSILNTTNSSGARVFGAGPVNPNPPTNSAVVVPNNFLSLSFITCILMSLIRNHLQI